MAKILSSAVLAAVVVAMCAAAAPSNLFGKPFHKVQKAGIDAMPQIYGALKMGHGFNALTGQSGDFPIVDWTFEGGQTWTSPTGTTYKIPDQTYFSPQTETHTVTCTKISTSYSDIFSAYSSSYSFSVGIDAGTFGLSVGYSHELAKTSEEIKSNDKYYGFSTFYTNFYSLDMAPAYMLNMSFQAKQGLSFLPNTIKTKQDNQKYQEFVTSFGTHYPTLGDFGGMVRSISFLNKTFSHTHTTEMIAHQISLSFNYEMFKLAFGNKGNRSSIHIAQWFKDNAHTYNFWTGGNQTLQHNTTQDQWLYSIADQPGMVNTTLMPMDRLITWDNQKQATFAAFVKEYIKTKGKTDGFVYPPPNKQVDAAGIFSQEKKANVKAPVEPTLHKVATNSKK